MTTWKIEFMKCVPTVGRFENWVVECGWRCTGTQDNHSADAYGTCSFAVPDDVPTLAAPFETLTEPQVLQWVWGNGVDQDEIEAYLARQLDALANPPSVIQPLPWAA